MHICVLLQLCETRLGEYKQNLGPARWSPRGPGITNLKQITIMKTAKNVKIDSVKNVNEALGQIRAAAQSLNNCLRAINGALAGCKDEGCKEASALTARCECGSDVKTILGLMGIELTAKSKITFKDCKEKIFTKVLVGEAFGIYKNRPIKDEAGQRVYVIDEKKAEYVPLSVYCLQTVGKYDWTPAVWCKAVEQNWLPGRQMKKAENSAKKVQEYTHYFVKMEDGFMEINKDTVEF